MSWLSDAWDEVSSWAGNTWDWIKEQWDDFTDNFVYYMNNFWEWFGDAFILIIAIVILGYVGVAYGVFGWIWSGLKTIGGWIASGWEWITGWAAALYGYWEDFLDWLRWDDIKKISDIAEIVSPEYREAVQDLYGQISQVSEQLGLGTGFMLLALSDARNVILDASSLMGRSYDLGEVAWISNLTGYLNEFNDKAEDFKNNPEGLILDIQAYFEPDIIDTRVGFQTTLIDFMGASIKGLKETGLKLVQLKDTLEQSILHLPAQISGPIYRHMEDEFEAFDTFMDDKFTPAIENTQKVVGILTELTGNHEKQIGDIAGLMSNPGEMLANINELPEIERLSQEDQICEISSRGYRTESLERNQAIDDNNKELVLVEQALRKERKPPAFLQLEYHGPPKPVRIASGVFASWQVGDY